MPTEAKSRALPEGLAAAAAAAWRCNAAGVRGIGVDMTATDATQSMDAGGQVCGC